MLLYGAVIYLLVALLYPNSAAAEKGVIDGFVARRRPFFATVIALGFIDIADTLIKTEFYEMPGPPTQSYWLLMGFWIFFGAAAWLSRSHLFHRVFAYGWLVTTALWNVSTLNSL